MTKEVSMYNIIEIILLLLLVWWFVYIWTKIVKHNTVDKINKIYTSSMEFDKQLIKKLCLEK